MPDEANREGLQGDRGAGSSLAANGGPLPLASRGPSESGRPEGRPGRTDVDESGLRAFAAELLDGCAVGIIVLDAELRVVCMNKALERAFALPRDAAIGQNYRVLVEQRLKPIFEDPDGFARRVLGGDAQNSGAETFECHVLPGKGREDRWLERGAARIGAGPYAGGRIEHFYDITHRKLVEESLVASRRLFERMFHSMRDAVFVVDADMTIQQCNPAASEIFGYTEVEMVGQSTTILHGSPETHESFNAALVSGLREKGFLFLSELPMRRKSGEVFPTDLTVVPLEQEVGEGTGYVAVVRDVSDRVALDQMKSSFVANVSHELRSPLSSIMGYAEVLLDSDPAELTPTQREFLQVIYDSSQRLKWLVDDILDVSRIEADQFRLELAEVEPDVLVERTIEVLRPKAEEAGLALHSVIAAALPRVRADARRLQQVLENLVNNAIQFTPAGGTVQVSLRAEDAGYLVLEVVDTGVGIPPEDLPIIFERFRRGRNANQASAGGTGLGLYIVRSIVAAHGGRVEVESEVGRGSTFRAYFPLGGPSGIER
ncbi:MAG: PAS domain S-box protein [Anaerolineae bacterium]|nr:PAS domain S-box protein [Anaerolineae bacterium]